MRGRPPAWNDFGRLDSSLWTELVGVTSIGRVVLPAPVRQRVPFLAGDTSVAVLAILDARGCARIVPVDPDGDAILAAARLAIVEAPPPLRDDITLAAMAKYARLSVEPTGRFALPAGLAAHLQAERSAGVRVHVARGALSLWSEPAWLLEQAGRFADLPG